MLTVPPVAIAPVEPSEVTVIVPSLLAVPVPADIIPIFSSPVILPFPAASFVTVPDDA